MKNIETQIDELALIVKQSFDLVEERFAGMDKRFNSIDQRFDILERGQEEMILRLDNKANRFELKELDKRVSVLESRD